MTDYQRGYKAALNTLLSTVLTAQAMGTSILSYPNLDTASRIKVEFGLTIYRECINTIEYMKEHVPVDPILN